MNEGVRAGSGGWAEILVAVPGRVERVRARLFLPFAVHRDVVREEFWVVTHVLTGCALPGRFTTHTDAVAMAVWVRDEFGDRVNSADLDVVCDALSGDEADIWDMACLFDVVPGRGGPYVRERLDEYREAVESVT